MKKLDADIEVKEWMLIPNYSVKRNFISTSEGEAYIELNSVEDNEEHWETMKVTAVEKDHFPYN